MMLTPQELERYRDGYADALRWVLDNIDIEIWDRAQIETILKCRSGGDAWDD